MLPGAAGASLGPVPTKGANDEGARLPRARAAGLGDVPDRRIEQPTDAIVRIDTSTICGTDLHILKGDVPEVKPGTILGHEAVGTVVEIGAAVTTIALGDRVLVSCITSCGRCRFCKEGHYGLCTGGGGWIFGHLIDGLQAEFARVPFADTSVYKVPDGLTDEQVLFLADILPDGVRGRRPQRRRPAGRHRRDRRRRPDRPGDDHDREAVHAGADHRDRPRRRAPREGARVRRRRRRSTTAARTRSRSVMELTDGLGADVAIEAVGVPETFELCTELIRPGGRVANVGVHGNAGDAPPREAVDPRRDDHDRARRHRHTPKLLRLIEGGRLDPTLFATHRFALADTEEAYDVFATRPRRTRSRSCCAPRR